ncbi:acyltransferase family-domain-containing protein [Xylariales sp. AK1849]|nr:acyltransferase family-domain-containing protein [Xylariales sp. AK1849]
MGFLRPEDPSSEETEALIHPDNFDKHEDVELLLEKKKSSHPHSSSASWSRFLGGLVSLTRVDPSRQISIQVLRRFLVNHILPTLIFLIPSFITSIPQVSRGLGLASLNTTTKPLGPTAYLDGLRGYAAIIVYVYHWSYLWFPFLRKGWGTKNAENLLMQRPIVRVLHSGRASVSVFFVISGYVITIKTLSMIYKSQPERVLDSLAGSLFRRPLRLYLPILVSTLIILVLLRWDVFLADVTGGGGVPHRVEQLQDQLWDYWGHLVFMMNPFRAIPGRINMYGIPYNGDLWTIPVEFKGSVTVYVFLLAFARTRRWLHLASVVGCGVWLMQNGDLDMTLFCAGLVLAEASLIIPTGVSSSPAPLGGVPGVVKGAKRRSCTLLRHVVTLSLFIFACHLLSYPEQQGPEAPGFRWLSRHVPSIYADTEARIEWFWNSMGSMLVVVSLMYSAPVSISLNPFSCCLSLLRGKRQQKGDEVSTTLTTEPHTSTTSSCQHHEPRPQPLLQIPFTTAFAQYLGRISFSFYLSHGSVNHILGTRYLNPAWAAWREAEETALLLSKGGMNSTADATLRRAWATYMGVALWATIINTIVLLWISDVFWRVVDVRCVAATRWLEMKAWRK